MVYQLAYTTGEETVTYTFPYAELSTIWMTEVQAIKWSIEDINDDGHAGALRIPKYRGWLANVSAFIERWGERLLPSDIKLGVNSVERGLNMPETVWETPP